MERLTFLNGDEIPCVRNDQCFEEQSEHYCGPAIDRLAAYEDTGLMPPDVMHMRMDMAILTALFDGIDVDRMREIVAAERGGRVVVLPSKTVFELTWDAGPDCDLVCPVSIDGHDCCDFCDKGELFVYERTCRQEHIEQLGKTVFLTREEAEKALEGMGND